MSRTLTRPLPFPLQTRNYIPSRCNDGYTGNLCFTCAKGYSRAGEAGCGGCPNPVVNRIIIVIGVIVSVVVMGVLIYRTRKR